MEERPPRKLAVILHADVVGSTTLVQLNETLAHGRIRDAFRRLSDTVKAYGGIAHELRGDALVAEFERASDAVSTALTFQTANEEFNATLDDDIKPELRIGISMGEVVIADHTVTGGGAVLAQRLEQLAQAGGVCIQGAAHETVPQRLPFDYESLGEQHVKGFADPVRTYAVTLKAGAVIPSPERRSAARNKLAWRMTVGAVVFVSVVAGGVLTWLEPWESREEPALADRMAFPLPDNPSIAVLAFDNLSGDPGMEYLSDGISEGIIREISRFPQLFVIARNSSFTYKGRPVKIQTVSEELGVRYVVEGSLQSTDDRIRVTAQLIDATTGKHLWSNSFDRQRQDFFAVQDEITQTIVSTLAGRIERAERGRALRKPVKRLQAYEYVQQGIAQWLKWTKEANDQARKLHEKALALDPEYAEPYIGLAWVNVNNYRYGWSDESSPEESLELAFKMAQKAVQVDPFYYRSHWVLANVYMQRGDLTQAVAEYEQALELNPNSSKVLADAAEPLVYLGRAEEAVDQLRRAIRLNPYHDDWYLWSLGWAQYFAGQYKEALVSIRRMRDPPNAVRRTLAPVLARLGRLDEARLVAAEFLKNDPDFRIKELMKRWRFEDENYREKLAHDLRKVGFPE